MCIIGFVRSIVEHAAAGHHEAVALLSQRKLLVLPIANPDGYAWNAKTHPHGGGMKRKLTLTLTLTLTLPLPLPLTLT